MSLLRRRYTVLLTAACLASITGCQAGNEVDSAPWRREASFADQIEQAIVDATENNASDRQIELLRVAQGDGEVSVELVREAVANTVTCFAEHDADASPQDTERVPGLVVPGYVVGFDNVLTDAEMDRLFDLCDTAEFRWISSVYQSQPTSRDVVGAYVMGQEPVLRACLEAAGLKPDSESNGWELAMYALVVDDAVAGTGGAGIACLTDARISGL